MYGIGQSVRLQVQSAHASAGPDVFEIDEEWGRSTTATSAAGRHMGCGERVRQVRRSEIEPEGTADECRSSLELVDRNVDSRGEQGSERPFQPFRGHQFDEVTVRHPGVAEQLSRRAWGPLEGDAANEVQPPLRSLRLPRPVRGSSLIRGNALSQEAGQ